MSENQESVATDGVASIENGHIQIKDPLPGGKPATVVADSSVLVFINEVPISEPVEVFSRTSIRVTLPLKTFPSYSPSLKVDGDQMKAWLGLEVHAPGLFYKLEDSPPVHTLTIRIQEEYVPLNAFEEIKTDLLGLIQARGIAFGLKQDVFEQLLANPTVEPVCIAEGQPAQWQCDEFEETYAFSAPPAGPEALARPPILFQFPMLKACKAGEVLVKKIPGQVSQEGYNVLGEKLPIPEIRRPLLAVDSTVRLQQNKELAVSSFGGIPSFNGRDVRVCPCYTYTDPIQGSRGGIMDIKGTVQVASDVLDQAQIWSSQHIEVYGQVSHAVLEANENIFVHGNVIKSNLASGGDTSASMRLIPPVQALLEQLQKVYDLFRALRQSVPQLAQSPEKKLMINLIKTQFPQLLPEVNQLWDLLKSMKKLQARKVMILKVVLSNLMNLEQKEVNTEIFKDWIDKLSEFFENLKNLENLFSHIYMSYAQGSTVISQGNIYVVGEGCYHCHLQARHHIVISGNPGYCRESRIEAGGNLVVRELGSPNNSHLHVKLQESSHVWARLIYPGVEIRFGTLEPFYVMERMENVEIYVEKEQVRVRLVNFQAL